MLNKIDTLESAIDLKQLPNVSADAAKLTAIRIGDLHANFIKAIWILVRYGIYKIEKTKYDELCSVYLSPLPLTQEQYLTIQKILNDDLQLVTNKKCITWMGDTRCDRGRNDILIALLDAKLQRDEVPVRTLISNHDAAYLEGIDFFYTGKPNIDETQCVSYNELKDMIKSDKVNINLQDVRENLQKNYLPTLMLFDYTYVENNQELTIFSHAPIDLDDIEQVADQFEVNCNFSSPQGIMDTLDGINQEFSYAVRQNLTSLVLKKDKPAFNVIWQREEQLYEKRGYEETRDSASIGEKLGYPANIKFCYGHDLEYQDVPNNIIRLDNSIGKAGLENHEQRQEIAYISDAPLSIRKKLYLNVDRSRKKYLEGWENILTDEHSGYKKNLQDLGKALKALIKGYNEEPKIKALLQQQLEAVQQEISLINNNSLGSPEKEDEFKVLYNKLVDVNTINKFGRIPEKQIETEEPRHYRKAIKSITLHREFNLTETNKILKQYLVPKDPKVHYLIDHVKELIDKKEVQPTRAQDNPPTLEHQPPNQSPTGIQLPGVNPQLTNNPLQPDVHQSSEETKPITLEISNQQALIHKEEVQPTRKLDNPITEEHQPPNQSPTRIQDPELKQPLTKPPSQPNQPQSSSEKPKSITPQPIWGFFIQLMAQPATLWILTICCIVTLSYAMLFLGPVVGVHGWAEIAKSSAKALHTSSKVLGNTAIAGASAALVTSGLAGISFFNQPKEQPQQENLTEPNTKNNI